MPIYSLKCRHCGHTQDEIIGISELEGMDCTNLNLIKLKIKCKKCGKHKFSKQVTAHGKMPHNWSSWQRKP